MCYGEAKVWQSKSDGERPGGASLAQRRRGALRIEAALMPSL